MTPKDQRRFCALCEKLQPVAGMIIVGHAWLCLDCSGKVPPSYNMLATLMAASVDNLVEAVDRLTEAVEASGEGGRC